MNYITKPLSVVLQLIMLFIVISAAYDFISQPPDIGMAVFKSVIAALIWYASKQTKDRKSISEVQK